MLGPVLEKEGVGIADIVGVDVRAVNNGLAVFDLLQVEFLLG